VDNLNASILHIACENADFEMIKMLIERYNMPVDILDKDQDTPLFYASRQGNLDVIKYLDSKGANLEHKDFQDRTPLYV
jgi:ankyrin repeat protein